MSDPAPGTIYEGDCIEWMKEWPNSYFDCVITDPPYDLLQGSRGGSGRSNNPDTPAGRHGTKAGGFMGLAWDSTGIAFRAETWAEALRVAKPGAYLLAFGGTRTVHRMTTAIEDAGWEIRDVLVWGYNCLSDDTEILTEDGWVLYHKANEGSLAATFDTRTGLLDWQTIEAVHTYAHQGQMVEVGPQLVTPNHRVVLEASRQPQVPLPGHEDLRGLWDRLPHVQSVSSDAGQDMLFGMPRGNYQGSPSPQADLGTEIDAGLLHHVRDGLLSTKRVDTKVQGSVLLLEMQREEEGAKSAIQERGSTLDRGAQTTTIGAISRRRKSVLEGRRYVFQEAWELLGREVHPLTRVGETDGTERRLHHGAQARDGRDVRVSHDSNRGGEPREPQSRGQPSGESDNVARQPYSQVVRVGEVPGRDGQSDKVRLVDGYDGIVWCITVPTGAFVARRNGVVFVTGNSGFPKSRNIGKDIDRLLGAEREVIGTTNTRDIRHGQGRPQGWGLDKSHRDEDVYIDRDVTIPTTDEAKRFEGFGTALKPAWEPIVMGRKPLSESSVAANVLVHGVGGIDINATRIPLNPNEPPYVINTFDDGAKPFGGGAGHAYTSRTVAPKGRDGEDSSDRRYTEEGVTNFAATPGPRGGDDRGRYPANVLLTDPIFDGDYEGVVGGGDRSSGVMKAGTQRDSRSVDYGLMPDTATLTDTYGDSGGGSRFFLIPKAARSEREPNWHGLEEFEEADLTNTVGPMAGRGQAGLRCVKCSKWKVSGNPCVCEEPEWEQSKFNRPKIYNNHATVKPLDLMCHLVRLVCPPGSIVLDPFLGSGTTAKAAELEGRRWIGIEKDAHHAKIARARLAGTQQGLGLE